MINPTCRSCDSTTALRYGSWGVLCSTCLFQKITSEMKATFGSKSPDSVDDMLDKLDKGIKPEGWNGLDLVLCWACSDPIGYFDIAVEHPTECNECRDEK